VFARACEIGLEGIVSKRVGSAYWSGNCRNWTKANPSFTRLALHEKRGVNSSPAESISFRTGQNHSEKGSSSPWPRTPIPHRLMYWVEPTPVPSAATATHGPKGNKLTSGLAAARAGTLRYLGPKRVHNADEIMARLSQALVQVMKRLPSGRVEAAVARRLPHRSGLAAFPHPALLMSNPVSSRSASPDVNEPRRRQWVGAQKSVEPVP